VEGPRRKFGDNKGCRRSIISLIPLSPAPIGPSQLLRFFHMIRYFHFIRACLLLSSRYQIGWLFIHVDLYKKS
jgi:hypothetical protein